MSRFFCALPGTNCVSVRVRDGWFGLDYGAGFFYFCPDSGHAMTVWSYRDWRWVV